MNDSNPFMPRVYGIGADGLPVASLEYFVDDGLITGPTPSAGHKAYQRLVWFLQSRLGMRICAAKTEGPAQQMEFLGLVLDSVGSAYGGPNTHVSEERKLRCQSVVELFLRRHRAGGKILRRELASLIGELSFAANCIPAGRTFLKRLYECLYEDAADTKGPAEDFDRYVNVTSDAIRDARYFIFGD